MNRWHALTRRGLDSILDDSALSPVKDGKANPLRRRQSSLPSDGGNGVSKEYDDTLSPVRVTRKLTLLKNSKRSGHPSELTLSATSRSQLEME